MSSSIKCLDGKETIATCHDGSYEMNLFLSTAFWTHRKEGIEKRQTIASTTPEQTLHSSVRDSRMGGGFKVTSNYEFSSYSLLRRFSEGELAYITHSLVSKALVRLKSLLLYHC